MSQAEQFNRPTPNKTGNVLPNQSVLPSTMQSQPLPQQKQLSQLHTVQQQTSQPEIAQSHPPQPHTSQPQMSQPQTSQPQVSQQQKMSEQPTLADKWKEAVDSLDQPPQSNSNAAENVVPSLDSQWSSQKQPPSLDTQWKSERPSEPQTSIPTSEAKVSLSFCTESRQLLFLTIQRCLQQTIINDY